MKGQPASNVFEQLILDLTPRYGAGEARSIARIVFEDAFDTRRPGEKVFTAVEEIRFSAIRRRLLAGEPLQYVLEQADFFGLKFLVSPAVLIPRQETEELVAWVLDWLKANNNASPTVLDIGLGSGCIAVTLKKKWPGIRLFGLEKSPEALAIARENASRILNAPADGFYQGDIFDPAAGAPFPPLDLIVSNPPYIPRTEQHLMPEHVRLREPDLALFVEDDDPLIFYRTIIAFAREKLLPGGALFFECNEFNAPAVAGLMQAAGFAPVELRKDLAGADRMLMGRI